jgi:hypothetical protein
MRLRKKRINQNMDSLLDTMANVVGILIIILAVTKIGVTSAIDRIKKETNIEITPQAMKLAEEQSKTITETLENIKSKWKDLEYKNETAKIDLPHLKEMLKKLQLESENDSRLIDIPIDYALHNNEFKNIQLNNYINELEDKIDQLKKVNDKYKIAYDKLLGNENIGKDTISVPDPRPAPENLKLTSYVCKQGKIVKIDLGKLIDKIYDKMKSKVKIDKDITFQEIKRYINNQNLGDENFQIELEVWKRNSGNRYLKCIFKWRNSNVGESSENIKKENSKYQEHIKTLKENENCIIFVVWPDSFNTYLTARQISDSYGISAGWRLREADNELSINLLDKEAKGSDQVEIEID